MAMPRSEPRLGALPDPGQATTLDDLAEALRALKVWAGSPSYDAITTRINQTWQAAGRPDAELARRATVADCFKVGRRRISSDLVLAVVHALHPEVGYTTQWHQALQVVAGRTRAAAQVRVQDHLPAELTGFTGRGAELDRIRQAARNGAAATICTITGMAGVGKTQLAVQAAHSLAADAGFDQILFVNLRGFHPDPAQPPAEPAAVLDGFLRLLGMPGQRIPHDLPGRAAAYHRRLAGIRCLMVLDDAADADQVRPLLATAPGCTTLVTSRRGLTDLHPTVHLAVDGFSPREALEFLASAAVGIAVGADPGAPARIARRCGNLPLALGLIAAQFRSTPEWTLTDHADRLDERHRDRRLDSGVELALELSYLDLPATRRRLLRLASSHPGQEIDAYAAAALLDCDLSTAHAELDRLHRDSLIQPATPGRYTLHDLVRAYAAGRAVDEDRPAARRAALTRLFDHYVAACAVAMDTLHPAERDRRPRVAAAATPTPALNDPETARSWLDTERPTLVAVAAYTAGHGWTNHTTTLSGTLFRYLNGGYHTDALELHGHALNAATRAGSAVDRAHALNGLATAHLQLSRHGPAAAFLRRALHEFRQAGDLTGQARTLGNLGNIELRLCQYPQAAEHYEQSLALFRQLRQTTGEARVLGNLGIVEGRLGRHGEAVTHLRQALDWYRRNGDQTGEAETLVDLGYVEAKLGDPRPATEYLQRALTLHRQRGNRDGEADALDQLGIAHNRLGQLAEAIGYHRHALDIYTEMGDREGQAWAHNGLGEAALAAGRPADALAHHTEAYAIATEIAHGDQQARAETGMANARAALDPQPLT